MQHKTIEDLRNQIETIDKELLILLSQRMHFSKEIAYLKNENKEKIVQLNVWRFQLENRLNENNKLNMDTEFLIQIFSMIHEESIRIQNQEVDKLK